ncbi:hypothetical protein [Absidia glauca]|uniref:F-box domain-containing protein n=1 Tax=Absidia glauca TaxID=4829 RepID=A0A168SV53_ABSGL|nr:hypothetical protein [Absidia glauca]
MAGPCLNLPHEVISLIASHLEWHDDLNECALINKQFYTATVPLLYQAPTEISCTSLLGCLITARQHHQSNLLRSSPLGNYIRTLELSVFDSPTATILLLSLTPFLESLDLIDDTVTEDSVEYVWDLCPRLKKVHLDGIPINNLHGLANYCRQLASLRITRCDRLPPAALEPLIASSLTTLVFEECNWFTENETAHHISQLHLLEKLEFDRCDSSTDRFLQRLLSPPATNRSVFPRLKSLIIRVTPVVRFLPPRKLVSSIASLPLLNSLTLEIATVTLATLSALTTSPLLQSVTLHAPSYDISSQELRNLIRDRPQWTSLHLVGCLLPQRSFPETEQLYHHKGIMLKHSTLNRIWRNIDFYVAPENDIPCQIDHYEYQRSDMHFALFPQY